VTVTDALHTTLIHPAHDDATWWRHAVIYQVYPRSWADADGDGMGDLPGITARLPHLASLGVDAVWLSPFYRSPQADAGYDVADYRDVDPLFGTLADADGMVARAHQLGLKVIVDLVPNHTSDEHAWFRAALASAPGSRERERYIFRDGLGSDGYEPPNDWHSVFGGAGWTRVTEADGRPGQWYLHLFDVKQPDLNWDNPEVRAEFESILKFWLDRGIDGFRVDVAHGLVKEEGLPDYDAELHILDGEVKDGSPQPPMWDQDGVHEIYRQWRKILDGYGQPERILCAEAWVRPQARAVRYVRPDEMHQAFNFDFLKTPWLADDLRRVVRDSLEAADSVGAPSTWVLSNHDVVRHASRLGLPVGERQPNGIGPDDPQPDRELGLRRARAATTLMLALPGGAYLYQGEELGLPDSTDMPAEFRQDPTFIRTHGKEIGRDGCRVPVPWEKSAPSFGFGPSANSWLPQPAVYGEYAVDQQVGVEGSTLELYRTLLALRRERALGTGGLAEGDGFGNDVVALVNSGAAGDTLVLANLGAEPVALPEGARVLVASGPLTDVGGVPTDTTVWAAL
jgi:alpha-glucosidase